MKCCQCDKFALYAVGPEGKEAPLCLDCYCKWKNVHHQDQVMHERNLNYLAGQIESITGMPGTVPRFPERGTVIQTGGITLNNIHVSNSEIGVLNTGTIENVDTTVTVLKTEGNSELAAAITTLSEAVIKAGEISTDQKNQILELLGSISQEAVAPNEKRKLAVVRAILAELSGVLGEVATLTRAWEKARTIFLNVFGI